MKPSKAFLKGLRRRFFGKRKQKVFVIGFHKTGTTTMGKALQILGYKVCGSLKEGYDYGSQPNPKKYVFERGLRNLEIYEAFQDTPWFIFYKELFDIYPDAFFILTIRPEEKWLNSVQKHFGDKKFHYHDLIYDTANSLTEGDHYLDQYRKHNEEVKTFFGENPNFKTIKIEEATWLDLTTLLKISPPGIPFPHANKANYRQGRFLKLKKWIKKAYYK